LFQHILFPYLREIDSYDRGLENVIGGIIINRIILLFPYLVQVRIRALDIGISIFAAMQTTKQGCIVARASAAVAEANGGLERCAPRRRPQCQQLHRQLSCHKT